MMNIQSRGASRLNVAAEGALAGFCVWGQSQYWASTALPALHCRPACVWPPLQCRFLSDLCGRCCSGGPASRQLYRTWQELKSPAIRADNSSQNSRAGSPVLAALQWLIKRGSPLSAGCCCVAVHGIKECGCSYAQEVTHKMETEV